MEIARGIEWRGGIEGRLVLLRSGEANHETRSAEEFLDYIRSHQATFETREFERIGSWAYFAAVCQVRTTTAGFVLAAADQVVDPKALVSSDENSNAAFQSGVARVRQYLARIRAQPGGALADAALSYVKLAAVPK